MSTYEEIADYREECIDFKRLEMEDLYSRVIYTDKKEIITRLLQGEKFFHEILYDYKSNYSAIEIGFIGDEFRLIKNGIQLNKFDINSLKKVFTSNFYRLLKKEECKNTKRW